MSKTKVSFSFDDGRIDNITLAKDFLCPHGIPASFNITTGYVDGSIDASRRPSPKEAISVEDVIYLFGQKTFEIALHGDMHQNTVADIENGRKKICRWLSLPENTAFGFASPCSVMSMEQVKRDADYLNSDVLKYVRIGTVENGKFWKKARRLEKAMERMRKNGVLSRVLFLLDRVFHLTERADLFKYLDSVLERKGDYHVIPSITIHRDMPKKRVEDIVRFAEKRGFSVILMMHSVSEDEKDSDYYTYRLRDFCGLCDFLKEEERKGKLEITTVADLYESLPV